MARHEGDVREGEGTARLEPAAVRVDVGTGQPPGPVGAQPVLRTLHCALLPAPEWGHKSGQTLGDIRLKAHIPNSN